ncbi:MAG TPA: hypothetical protein VLB46_11410 [Pyrinomonadaceae bacterium]|nr:hypothetical protein [Pyrinomonadaceae bacterium]
MDFQDENFSFRPKLFSLLIIPLGYLFWAYVCSQRPGNTDWYFFGRQLYMPFWAGKWSYVSFYSVILITWIATIFFTRTWLAAFFIWVLPILGIIGWILCTLYLLLTQFTRVVNFILFLVILFFGILLLARKYREKTKN